LTQTTNPIALQAGGDCWTACQETDAILYSPLGLHIAPHIAEKLDVPAIGTFELPVHQTRSFPGYGSPTQRSLGRLGNSLTHITGQAILFLPYSSLVNSFRQRQLGLPPLRRWIHYGTRWQARMPVVYGFSPLVVPRPPDWGRHIEITGYWFLDTPGSWEPPPMLASFLSAGPPPVYVGFGSMISRDAERITDIVVQALRRTKQRGLLATGWGGLSQADLPEDVLLVESVPHDRIFHKVAAVVHHGGAGTTSAALRSGVPSVIVPFFFDQPFWGQRVLELGVGPPPVPYRRLSAERLADAIEAAVNDGRMRAQAAALGARIRAEDGVARAVEAISRLLAHHKDGRLASQPNEAEAVQHTGVVAQMPESC